MKVNLLIKKALIFWQEIILLIPIGWFLVTLFIDIYNGSLGMFDDWISIAAVCFHVIIFISLVGQFFLKNKTFGYILSFLLVLYSLFWIFASLAMPKTNPGNHLRPVIIIVSIFLVFAAITMSIKYSNGDSGDSENN